MEKAGERNAYRCDKCRGEIVTVNLVDGVTPFMVDCRAKWPGTCEGMAKSSFYRIDQASPAGWGWYRPDETELARLEALHPGVRQHVEAGGLLLRKLDNAERAIYGGQRVRSDGSATLLPPPKDTCPVCACKHPPEYPHDANSMYYLYRFFGLRKRFPTWADAAAHCTPALAAAWREQLEKLGGKWTAPEGDPIADPPGESLNQPVDMTEAMQVEVVAMGDFEFESEEDSE